MRQGESSGQDGTPVKILGFMVQKPSIRGAVGISSVQPQMFMVKVMNWKERERRACPSKSGLAQEWPQLVYVTSTLRVVLPTNLDV